MSSNWNKLFSLTLPQKGLILVAVPLLLELTFISLLSAMLTQSEQVAKRETRAKEVASKANYIYYLSSTLCKEMNAFLQGGNEGYKKVCEMSIRRLPVELDQLRNLVGDNELEVAIVDNAKLLNGISAESAGYLLAHQNQPKRLNEPYENELWRSAGHLSTQLQRILGYEALAGAASVAEQARWREKIKYLIFGGVALDVITTLTLAIFFLTSIVNRLNVMTANTAKLADGQALNPPLGGADEIARLDKTFHQMADALAEAMRKEKALVENALSVICSLDEEGRFTKVNIASLNVWGREPDSLIGKSYKELVPAEDLAETERNLLKIKETQSSGSFENRMKHEDGTLIDLSWSVQYSAAEKALFCVLHDIRERKELERLKQEFVALVSHDLRTPLTSIMGGLAIIKTGKLGTLDDRAQKILGSSERSGQRLLRLINDLLDMEKLEAGKFQLELDSCPIQPVLDRSVEAVSEFAAQNSINISPAQSKLWIYADEDRVEQVLVNLLSNAIKFSPAGGSIELSALENDGVIEVRVTDHGCGVPESHKEAIFEKFQQVRVSDAKKKKGTGLGLPICKAIIEQHGGSIGLESTEGEGSTFWFTLPLKAMT